MGRLLVSCLLNIKKRLTQPSKAFFQFYIYYQIEFSSKSYPPKSSNAIFSSGTPKSSKVLITEAFIIGGPQK